MAIIKIIVLKAKCPACPECEYIVLSGLEESEIHIPVCQLQNNLVRHAILFSAYMMLISRHAVKQWRVGVYEQTLFCTGRSYIGIFSK